MDEYLSFIERLKSADRFLITSHINPDGDAIGSSVALGLALERMGKEVVLYNCDPIPQNLAFLPEAARFTRRIAEGDSFDKAIMVDCSRRVRISDEFAKFKGFGEVLCVDHHILEAPEADFSLIDRGAASTGEVILRLVRCAGIKVDEKIAQCIYTTLAVDTGFFRYSNTSAHVFSVAAELVQAGASPWVVAKNLEESYPVSRLKLLAECLATLEVRLGGRYATMELRRKAMKRSGATVDQSDEFANFPRSIAGVEVAALFRELGEGNIKVSLRSKDTIDVAAIAKGFGGGGHKHAAGFKLNGQMKKVKIILESIVQKILLEPIS